MAPLRAVLGAHITAASGASDATAAARLLPRPARGPPRALASRIGPASGRDRGHSSASRCRGASLRGAQAPRSRPANTSRTLRSSFSTISSISARVAL